jgi:CheY-like chemotaxis protein
MNPKKILIINDDHDMVYQMTKWLKTSGFEVQSTFTGKEGVQMIGKNQFDLVLLDFHLKKEIDGMKNAQYFIPMIKNINPLIPIIVTSATQNNLARYQLDVTTTLIINSAFWKTFIECIEQILKRKERETNKQ